LITIAGWRARAKERRQSKKQLPPEYDFSATVLGIFVVCVVVAVMFSV
jgi:hypothetical protein